LSQARGDSSTTRTDSVVLGSPSFPRHGNIANITYLSELARCNPENDNVDIHILLDYGREFTFTVATPNNIFCCMENEGTDFFFSEPVVLVKNLTKANIERFPGVSAPRVF
jgi:hypothetical protein